MNKSFKNNLKMFKVLIITMMPLVSCINLAQHGSGSGAQVPQQSKSSLELRGRDMDSLPVARAIVKGLYNLPANISNVASWISSTLKLPQAWELAMTGVERGLHYTGKAAKFVGKEALYFVADVLFYPMQIAVAIKEEYIHKHYSEEELLKWASSKQGKQGKEIDGVADSIVVIGALMATGTAFITYLIPLFLTNPVSEGLAPMFTLSTGTLLGLLSPLLAGLAYYLSSAAYRAYLSLVEIYTDIMEKADAGTLTEAQAQEAQAKMLENIKVLEAETQKGEHPAIA